MDAAEATWREVQEGPLVEPKGEGCAFLFLLLSALPHGGNALAYATCLCTYERGTPYGE